MDQAYITTLPTRNLFLSIKQHRKLFTNATLNGDAWLTDRWINNVLILTLTRLKLKISNSVLFQTKLLQYVFVFLCIIVAYILQYGLSFLCHSLANHSWHMTYQTVNHKTQALCLSSNKFCIDLQDLYIHQTPSLLSLLVLSRSQLTVAC